MAIDIVDLLCQLMHEKVWLLDEIFAPFMCPVRIFDGVWLLLRLLRVACDDVCYVTHID